ncbi:MAG: hypothetical protein Q9166_002246 [cf. Caloplaca sp. 2 TL-2023]
MGAEQHVASMGDLKMRENFKEREAKMKRNKRMEQGARIVGQGIGLAGAKGPVKQGQVIFGAISAGLGVGGSMMRQSNQRPVPQATHQPAPVYNNYYFSNNSFDPSQTDEQGYADAEYEEMEDQDQQYYYNDPEEIMWHQQQQQQIQ